MILMYCIIDIQPDDLSEVSSAMLHYINHFVNYQTNNADYYWFDNTGKPQYIPLCLCLLPYTFEKIFCVINLAIYEKFHVTQCSS